ncbi:hypothetical protein ND925_22810 [Vibrio diabolicus]|uniref:hypothetical protein n=1 Tax=Vibrio TaxID=662 RepID=UPI00094181E8|nr:MULTISPECIES: hypothetical protein [Vibrio]MCR9608634.1 hypothetical protein [Vibrio alginolyticus]MCF7453392.1 hypothetical protein [Vibrio sp. A1-1]MCG6223456.1 hypothetical protein [Vibrio diabolicus]MCR9615784.1 hypothetical protein [Vibrio alginolyticus]MCR9684974.1 hypothetical protein [Vibrio antiquarius]
MLKFNRTLLTAIVCLAAMLLSSVAPMAKASAPVKTIEVRDIIVQQAALHKQLGVNDDCVELHHDESAINKAQQSHTSCSSSCMVKIPANLSQNDLLLLPYSLALIDRPLVEKVVTVITKLYRPPIV